MDGCAADIIFTMAPVATTDSTAVNGSDIASLKAAVKVFNPFYSPPAVDDDDGSYQFAQYKVCSVHPQFVYVNPD